MIIHPMFSESKSFREGNSKYEGMHKCMEVIEGHTPLVYLDTPLSSERKNKPNIQFGQNIFGISGSSRDPFQYPSFVLEVVTHMR